MVLPALALVLVLQAALPQSQVQDPALGATTRPSVPLLHTATGITISRAEYLEHLLATYGHARLEELAFDRILELEVRALPKEHLAPQVHRALEAPEVVARERRAERVRMEFDGDGAAEVAANATLGFTAAQALAAEQLAVLREARITALVQAGRSEDDKSLRRIFDERYGVDGTRVVVRHVYQSFGAIAAEFRTRHVEAPASRVEAICQERVAALWQQHESGTAFEDLVAMGSDDPQARRMAVSATERQLAGIIPDYNFQHFGVEFAAAVRAMRPGEVRGPLKTTHGYHIVKLDSAVKTEFAAVLPELRELLRAAPPSLEEQRKLRERLAKQHGLAAALPR